MILFWASVFQYLGIAVRDAELFFVELMATGGLCVLAAIIQAKRAWLQEY